MNSKEDIDRNTLNNFQIKLLNWYEENNRNFLWRTTNNPYNMIIAEIMLQKTNAEKVEKIYPRFIEKFPDFKSIIKASEKKLKEELKYLGLQNQKVPILKKLSKFCLEHYNNSLPSNKEDLLNIKGIGDYIANAVLCFAFNQRVPIIDGNVVRILNRAFNIKSKKKNPRTDKEIWNQMEKMLPKKEYKKFNYALLDFASQICKFYNPRCEDCFFNRNCHFYKEELKK